MDYDKDLFASLLKIARGKRSINQYGNLTKVDPSYISRLERKLVGKAPSPEVIRKLTEKAHRVTYEELMTAAGYLSRPEAPSFYQQDIYLFEVAESMPEYSQLSQIEKLSLGEIFSFIAQDNSMQGSRIMKGDKVLIRRAEEIANGELALVILQSEELILRRLYKLENIFILQPDNPNCKLKFAGEEDVRIWGKVIKALFTP